LARLLAEPGQDFLALDLAGLPKEAGKVGDLGEFLDADARMAYRQRLCEMQEDLREAETNHDLGRSEKCREEMEHLTRQLAEAVGLGGRSRRAGVPGERARQSVTKAIRNSIRKVAEDHEPLGRYLSNTIRTGFICRFDPDPGRPLDWRVQS
jgi:non-specific serine/threonine protein kinase